ncbi:MAG: carbamoyl-phosphate synthase large subunit [Spirochaetes bacterium]|nr:carbamoyl-phosphate synthase large subunit [Spirochaetota bacterium]
MPKRTDIKSIMIIGSGPIVIGQACEFDYSGTQACKALKEEGYRVILVNSNPATIMTDQELADATYIEPLIPDALEKIIKKERPDALLPTLGGQTALNLSIMLAETGVLKKYKVELIGASEKAIKKAEDRDLFKKAMRKIGLDVPESGYARSLKEAKLIVKRIGYPIIIRPSFTLGGEGGTIVENDQELPRKVEWGLSKSPNHTILMEESLIGWKEYELEVMRDIKDNVIIICSIENFDAMGIHTGDSITVAPAQTLSDKEYQLMREASKKIIREIGVDTGGSNIQFANHPQTGRMVVIEMNPRVSRSSALASKATGFPIAKFAAKLACGYSLDEIPNDITKKTPASFEPVLDYVVTKIPRFAFEKFTQADETLNTSMKSIGEVMAIGRTFKESLQKALRGLEIKRYGLGGDGLAYQKIIELAPGLGGPALKGIMEEIKRNLYVPNCDRVFKIKYALELGISADEIYRLSHIDRWFIYQIKEILDMETRLRKEKLSDDLLKQAKRMGFSDYQIGYLSGKNEKQIRKIRQLRKINPTYKLVDTCSAEFPAYTPYYYSTYETEDEVKTDNRKKVMVIGSGPNRIGQGIEFDACCVHASMALRDMGYESIMVNSNPETVSTDYDISDRLYFEPITPEDVIHIYQKEKPLGVILQFGGQTSINIAHALHEAGVRILGTSVKYIDIAEDREKYSKLLKSLNIPMPAYGMATTIEEAKRIAKRIGYPVMIRPSYVLGGRAMEIVYEESKLESFFREAASVSEKYSVLIDKFLENALEMEVDAMCDGKDVYFPGIIEHIEEAGVHSGDSGGIFPSFSVPENIKKLAKKYSTKIARAFKTIGLLNIQMALKGNVLYVLEVNPRASRTVPYVSKVCGIPLAKMATQVILGKKIKDLKLKEYKGEFIGIKESVFPFIRFTNTDTVLGPEMRSTGEVMGYGKTFKEAFWKSQAAASMVISDKPGNMIVSLSRTNKDEAFPSVKKLYNIGYRIYATEGTHLYLKERGIKSTMIPKISEGKDNILDYIRKGHIKMIINTPSGRRSLSDGFLIRREAYINNIPIYTTVRGLQAVADSLPLKKWDVYRIQH